MMAKHLYQRLAFLLVLLLAWPAAAQPNIVLIMADDLGYGDLGCYGSEDQHTPHLDALAEAGVRLTDYHSNGTVCSPTRASLMTGRYPQRTGVEGVVTAANHREAGLPLEEVTVAEVLRDAGYATAIFGKWHVGYDPAFGPTQQGFDTFEGFVSGNIDYQSKIDQVGEEDWWVGGERRFEPGYLTSLITDRAVDWIEEHKEQPFFLYVAHGAPHYPYQGPDDAGFREAGVVQVGGPRRDVAAAYREMITAMDDSVGRVVAALREHGLEENTLILFCSDNGCTPNVGSSGPWRGHKGQVYEGGHRVPMIAAWPGTIRPGEVSDEMVMGMDLLPTFAALAGAELAEGLVLDGVNLVDTWEDGPAEARRVHWVSRNQGAMRAGRWKLVVRDSEVLGLYDLDEDPGEQHDVSAEQGGIVMKMLAEHRAWLAETREGVVRVSP